MLALGDFVDHLTGSKATKSLPCRAHNNLIGHRNSVAILGADPADKNGVGPLRLTIWCFIASEQGSPTIRLRGLLLEKLVNRFHLNPLAHVAH